MKLFRIWLIAALATLTMFPATTHAQVTFNASNVYVASEVRGSAGVVASGQIVPVFNTPLQANAVSGTSIANADGTFISSPGYALMRIDFDEIRSASLTHYASSWSILSFQLSQTMAYELTGSFIYIGTESSHYTVSLHPGPTPIYSGTANMSSSGTATVGSLPLGPGGPTTGFLGPGFYTLVLESFVQANLGLEAASASGFMQLQLGSLPCPADVDDDDTVGVLDLLDLLAAWGPNPGHPADIDGNGAVSVTDLLDLLADWGDCP